MCIINNCSGIILRNEFVLYKTNKYVCTFSLQVSEFTLADGQSGTSTSLLASLCHPEDTILLLGSHRIMPPSSGIYSVTTRVSPLMPSSSLEVKSFSATSGDDSLEELLLPNSTIAVGKSNFYH